jgi:hypothetical protein
MAGGNRVVFATLDLGADGLGLLVRKPQRGRLAVAITLSPDDDVDAGVVPVR